MRVFSLIMMLVRSFFSRLEGSSSKTSRARVFDHWTTNKEVVNESLKRGHWIVYYHKLQEFAASFPHQAG
jgi:hypothetical protein